MITHCVLLTREIGSHVLDTFEVYRGPSLAEATRYYDTAVYVLRRYFEWPSGSPRPALAVRVLSTFTCTRRPGLVAGDRFVLAEVPDRAPADPLPAFFGPITSERP